MLFFNKVNIKFRFLVFFILMIPGILSAKTAAFIGVQNLSQNPEYDYLAAFTEGVILFDLSSVKEITLVERNRLEKIISEQQLQVAGLTKEGQEKKSIEAGKLLAADYLISVEYTLVSGEVALTMRMADTTTGAVRVFTSRGTTENDIHKLSEGIAKSLTGKNYNFVNEAEKRSLLTLRDMIPGSISLFCNLINAEIQLDGKFAGYTTGNLYDAVIIRDLDPGTYTMRIHLTKDFGVVKLPEFSFSDWEEKITVKPGRSTTLRSVISHFNDTIYKQSRLLDAEYNLTDKKPDISESKSLSFTDRNGKNIPMKVTVSGSRKAEGTTASCIFHYEGKDYSFKVSKDENIKKENIGKVKFELKLNTSYSGKDVISVEVTRTDIYQGMHRE
ncbi:MAG: hypothetical protein V1874_09515 [Spirochaetota bacterium]